MCSRWEPLGGQLPADLAHGVIYGPCLVHLRGHVLETLAVATHGHWLADPWIEDPRGLLIHEVEHPARAIEGSRPVHVLVDVPQETSHTRLLSLYQVDRQIVQNQFQAGHWLLYQLLEIVVHVIYQKSLIRLWLPSTCPLSSLSLIFATYNTLMYATYLILTRNLCLPCYLWCSWLYWRDWGGGPQRTGWIRVEPECRRGRCLSG